MSDDKLFTSGNEHAVPSVDICRQAIHALRGYAYQITAAALEWLDLSDRAIIFLEVAEDYATVAENNLKAVQVKDTGASATVTLNSQSVRDAIHNFVKLTSNNIDKQVHLEFFTSSNIATEKQTPDSTFPIPGLSFWRQLAKGGDLTAMRLWLMSEKNSKDVRKFVESLSDEELRTDMLQKIHWNCGKPDYASLNEEFYERLIVIGKEKYSLSAHECQKIAPQILYHVLQTSLRKAPSLRVLNLASLYRFIDDASRLSIKINTLEQLVNIRQKNEGLNPAPEALTWITEAHEQPNNTILLPRERLTHEALEKLFHSGICLIYGSSGTGKSYISRYVAGKAGNPYQIVDFRDIQGHEAVSRIKVLISRIGAMNTQNIILEDFNCLNDPRIAGDITALFRALDRRDIKFILTCYSLPTNRLLTQTGISPGSVMECSYLTLEESNHLVTLHGGNAKLWGQLAYISGANGHPQLVHAFISGMAARGWPAPEIIDVLKSGMSSNDIKDEQESVRRYVIQGLPEQAREMLYRLSLITGSFTREAATMLGATPPPLSLPGELFDVLKGPWIESLKNDHFRISPLAAKSGKEVLTAAQQTTVHRDIATHFFKKGTNVDIEDIDKIIIHAMVGKHESILAALSLKLLTADEEIIQYLYDNVSVLRMLPLDASAWPDNPTISCALRITQFKILVLSRDKVQIKACWKILQNELKRASEIESSHYVYIAGLTSVLNTVGIARYLDNWFALVMELHYLISQPSEPGMFDMPASGQIDLSEVAPLFFTVGITGLSDLDKLREIIQNLDALSTDLRMHLLQFYQEINPDFSVLIQTAWTDDSATEAGSHSVQIYRDMAHTTAQWNLPALTTQCWIAASMITFEKLHDTSASLHILEVASSLNADKTMVTLTRMKILWKMEQHAQVCEEMQYLAKDAYLNNPVERVYLLRQAAISASKIEKWILAEKWFSLSQQEAQNIELDNMQVMAAGLSADTAVAALQAGNIKRSLEHIASAMTQLEKINHEDSLMAYYCHQVTRHVVLWMLSVIEGKKIDIDNKPIVVIPGCCSNPSPPEAIRQKEHTQIQMAWYILAELDIANNTQLGLIEKLTPRSENRYLIMMEDGLRNRLLLKEMLNLKEANVAKATYDFVSCRAFLATLHSTGGFNFDYKNLVWESIPALGQIATPSVLNMLNKILISYFIIAACKNHVVNITILNEKIVQHFGENIAHNSLLSRIVANNGVYDDKIRSILSIGQGMCRSPAHYCQAGICALLLVRHLYNRNELITQIAQWQRYIWKSLVRWGSLNAPSIISALNREHNDGIFLHNLLSETAKFTKIKLSETILIELKSVSLS